MSENDEIKAAMGFESFGRVTCRKNCIKAEKLPQLIPGTELTNRLADFPAESIKEGSHGVLSLLCRTTNFDALQKAVIYLKNQNNTVSIAKDLVSNSKLLQELEQEKVKFDKLTSAHFLTARAATNTFESLGKYIFLNRSAMKLATLDYIFQWTFGQSERQGDFSFADLCGGPGGFSEYLLWQMTQNGQKGHGYGITLKDAINNCDWRLPLNLCTSMTICYGEDGTGNLYSIPNIHSFRTVVRRRHPNGVDLTVADGGFLEARSQVNQELMMTRLVLAEVLAMFAVLRVGGDFVCKTFELVTPNMVELCWILHQSFDRFAVVKPITSRPASSERYIVAQGLRVGHPTSQLVAVLEDRLAKSKCDSTNDLKLHLLHNQAPLVNDKPFLRYLAATNRVLGASQLQACRRINEYAANTKKRKTRKEDVAVDPREYYQCWQLGRTSGHKVASDSTLGS